jgi:isoleucyl-tRNA synthetase
VSALSNEALAAHEKGESLVIDLDGESHALSEEDFEIVRRAAGELTVQEEGGYVAAIDPTVTPELRREGIARELVRTIQRLRKEARFAVSDRIRLQITGGTEIEQAAEGYKEYIAGEVLASEVMTGGQVPGNPDAVQTVGIMDETVSIALTRVHN